MKRLGEFLTLRSQLLVHAAALFLVKIDDVRKRTARFLVHLGVDFRCQLPLTIMLALATSHLLHAHELQQLWKSKQEQHSKQHQEQLQLARAWLAMPPTPPTRVATASKHTQARPRPTHTFHQHNTQATHSPGRSFEAPRDGSQCQPPASCGRPHVRF